MNLKNLIRDARPHALVLFAFFLVAYVYYIKTFQGKTHREDDVTQGLLKGTELRKYTDKDGNVPGWTNSIFSGMPGTMIKGKQEVTNYISKVNYITPFDRAEYPFRILLLSFIGFYLLMNAFKVKPLFGALAALAYGFATYSISSVEAAHYTKVLAMAMLPAVLGSFHLLFTGKYLTGGITLAFNMALQVYFFHYQIVYYTLICILVLGVYYIVVLVKENKVKQLITATLISLLAVGAGVASNLSKIRKTADFASHTMRGGNDMAKADASYNQKETGKNGLKRDYAFDWSYGKAETFTLLIPDFYGGSSSEKMTKKSKIYEATQNEEILEQGLPMYHGELTFTSGPIYIGAIVIFLFVLGMFVIKSSIKWPFFVLTVISLILGWGKHFGIINNFLFDYLPYYNKFRVPMMAFSIAQVTIPFIAFLGLKQLYETWGTPIKGKQAAKSPEAQVVVQADRDKFWEYSKYVFYGVGGFCLLMAIAGSSFMDMGGIVDEQLKQGGNGNIIPVLKEDRASLLQKDAFRSFIFIAIAFGSLWAWYTNKMKNTMAIAAIGIFAAIDLIGVDLRYLSWSDFIHEKGSLTDITPDAVDNQIMSDKDIHFRVFDLTNDPFNDNRGAAFHKMIGGYDPAKLSRYQDLIAEMLSKQEHSAKALDMLNCKYMIGSDSGNRRSVMPRFSVNGNAWFIQKLSPAGNAAKEMETLKKIDNKSEAVYDQSFEVNKGLKEAQFSVDSMSSVKLDTYHPDTMNYSVNTGSEGFLVFSEIWYDNWKAEIDGKPVPLYKVNYTLRGISVPAGSKKVKLYFDKGTNSNEKIDRIASISILIGMLLVIALWVRSYFKAEA